jgi:hypothetical protein
VIRGLATPSTTFRLRSHARWVLAGSLLAAATLRAIPLSAQRTSATLDVGGAALGYRDSPTTTGATLAPNVRLDWTRATLAATGSASRLGSVGWSSQGGIDASLFTPNLGPIVGELSASVGGAVATGLVHTGQALGVARAHLMATRAGAWGGVGGGGAWDGAVRRPVGQYEGGAWVRLGMVTAVASATPTTVDDTLRYTDAAAALRLTASSLEIGASLGIRRGRRLPAYAANERAWGGASAAIWFLDWAAVVGSAGSYPVDLTQGFPGGRYAMLGIRLGTRPVQAGARSLMRDRTPERAASGAHPLDVTRAAGVLAMTLAPVSGGSTAPGERTLRVHAPAAARVEIAGDFSGWQPVVLTRVGGGWWAGQVTLPPGTQQLAVRADGGAWLVPPGLPAITDEFGGSVGLLVDR